MAKGLKTGGRTKGVANKTTAETKEIIQKIVSNELDNIETLLKQLVPKERIDAVIKMLPYIVPKQQEVELKDGLESKPKKDYSKYSTEDLKAILEISKKYEEKKKTELP